MDTNEINSATSATTPTPVAPAEPTEPSITDAEKVRAALNLPADQFTMGDRTFQIKDLEYDEYCQFVILLEPLLKLFVKGLATSRGVSVPGIEIDADSVTASGLAKYCGQSLPEMVRIICAQTDPTITVEEVKKLGKTPLTLAAIVLRQVVQNGIIRDFTSFFGQLLPLMTT